MKQTYTNWKIAYLIIISMTSVVAIATIPQGSAATSHLVINESYYNYQDVYESAQWVEIYNPTESSQDISWWILRFDEMKGVNVFPSGTIIDSGAFIIVTRDITAFQSQFSVPDGTQVLDDDVMLENFAALPTGTLRLIDNNDNLVDHLVYGGGSGAAPFVAPPNSVARYKFGYDTDQCWEDFYVEIVPTPGEENRREYSPPGVGGVLIPIDKLVLLAPYIISASIILAATVATAVYVKRRNKEQ